MGCLCCSCTLWLKTIKPGRKMLVITGLFVILFPKASKGNRRTGISEPLNAHLSTKSHHQIFKSINTVGGHCALLKVSFFKTLQWKLGSETEPKLLLCPCLLALYKLHFILTQMFWHFSNVILINVSLKQLVDPFSRWQHFKRVTPSTARVARLW